jgi:hypothetical protein
MHVRTHTQRPRFEHVALAAWVARRPDDDERSALRREFPALLDDFERENGRICRLYLGHESFAAACLTEQDEIVITVGRNLPGGSDDVVAVLGRCQSLAAVAGRRLSRFDLRMFQNMAFSVIEEALRLLDRSDGPEPEPGTLALLHRRLGHAEAFMLRCGARRRQPQLRSIATRLIGSA